MHKAVTLSFDIFCRVIDNFGDIGVCWRLAKQLASMPPTYPVRLWVNDIHSFAKIEPAINSRLSQQIVAGVDIVHWTDSLPVLTPHLVVIEAFACDPPTQFLDRMAGQSRLWINLEYLSGEAWVESCHALPSIQSSGVRKSFFFPGFTDATGGLLRESNLLATRDQWLTQPALRWELLKYIDVPTELVAGLQDGWRQVFLFCYPTAPVPALLSALTQHTVPTVIIAPTGVFPSLKNLAYKHIHIVEAPFVEQNNFDKLLWSSDLNFVRGEDSLVRAIWAGKPLIWQIYEQDEGAHLVKLQAWLHHTPLAPAIQQLITTWNSGPSAAFSTQLQHALEEKNWLRWQKNAHEFCQQLARQTDLANALVKFCAKNL